MWRYNQNFQDDRLLDFLPISVIIEVSDIEDALLNATVLFSVNANEYRFIRSMIPHFSRALYDLFQHRLAVYKNYERWKSEFLGELVILFLDKIPLLNQLYRDLDEFYIRDFEEWKDFGKDFTGNYLIDNFENQDFIHRLENNRDFIQNVTFWQHDNNITNRITTENQQFQSNTQFDSITDNTTDTKSLEHTTGRFFDTPQSQVNSLGIDGFGVITMVDVIRERYPNSGREELPTPPISVAIGFQHTTNDLPDFLTNLTTADGAAASIVNSIQEVYTNTDFISNRDTIQIQDTVHDLLRDTIEDTTNNTQFQEDFTSNRQTKFDEERNDTERTDWNHHIRRNNYAIQDRIATAIAAFNLTILRDISDRLRKFTLSVRIDVANYD